MDYFFIGVSGQNGPGQQADNIVAFNKGAGFVEEKAAVEVAVPGDTEIGAVVTHGVGGYGAVFREQRVGHPVGEGAIRFVLQFNEGKGQYFFQPVDNRPGTAVAGIDHKPQWLEIVPGHITEQMLDIGRPVVHFRNRYAPPRRTNFMPL